MPSSPQLQTEIGHGGPAHKVRHAHGLLHHARLARPISIALLAVVEYWRQDESRPNESLLLRLLYLRQLFLEISQGLRPEQRRRDTDEQTRKESSDVWSCRAKAPSGDTDEWYSPWLDRSDGPQLPQGQQRAVRTRGNGRMRRSFRCQHVPKLSAAEADPQRSFRRRKLQTPCGGEPVSSEVRGVNFGLWRVLA